MKPSREAPKETTDLLHEIRIITRRDVNPGTCHEEVTCEDYLNFEEKTAKKEWEGRLLACFGVVIQDSTIGDISALRVSGLWMVKRWTR
jgi:hypothetical protein